MDFLEKTLHLLLPRSSNNHRAKVLHSSGLLVLASFLILFQTVLNFLPKLGSSILGYASQISPDEVIRLTNEKRTQAGLPQLILNGTLSNAAQSKGNDMISKDYWAHTAPDGSQPWIFFTNAGYKYRYAGENLARDFNNPASAVEAWMSSPTHKENILNPKYKEIGIGVVEGYLAGVETTIIIQFFGSTYADKIVEPVAQILPVSPTSSPIATTAAVFTTPKATQQVLISPFTTTRTVSLAVVGLLLTIFLVDSLLVSKRRIHRIAGRSFAHMAFLGMILSIILILKAGKIL
ncbi:MAG: CAP domain-containing protein [Candidatus Woesebacteria bacterium]|nr:CAP domain-containing protein [Candidatus Woesebacteria bacterium]